LRKPLTLMLSDFRAPVFDGRFSDGRTAVSHAVRVRLLSGNLQIERPGAPVMAWPVTALQCAEPITRRSVDVLLHEPGRGGATLFVAEGQFVRALAQAAPQLTGRGQRWRYAKPWLAVSAAVLMVVGVGAAMDLSPARGLAELLPDKTRNDLGKQVIKSMTGQRRVCDAPAGVAALKVLADRLSQASGSKKTFGIVVLDYGVVNAFAAPGEEIVLLRGLLNKAESADEVAGVLAHEMGHGLELHPEAGIIRLVGLTAMTEFMLGGSGGTIANIGLLMAQLSYSRSAEREADAQALRLLKGAGIATDGFSTFFRRMAKDTGEAADKKAQGSRANPFDMMSSHPSVAERVATVDAQPKYAATPALSAAQWKDLKSICGVAGEIGPLPAPGPVKPQVAPKRVPGERVPGERGTPERTPPARKGDGGRDI
jgi:beta-barrel assembly-enhancing protease